MITAKELDMPIDARGYLNSCVHEGLFAHPSAGGGALTAKENPINFMALTKVAKAILHDQGLALSMGLLLFLESKYKISLLLQTELGETAVYIPKYLTSLDFVEANRRHEQGLNLSAFLSSSGVNAGLWTNFICTELNIIRLPCKHNGRWTQTLIPNIIGATDDEMARQISVYVDLLNKREHMGLALTEEDVKNLKVCVHFFYILHESTL